ncbi:MAG: ABC transporter substrate-binding protein [Clostridiales bacterium]|nr:ABC transporter substrate-binding protein [Clostridiales bacterium]
MIKRTLALILSLALLCCAFVGCGREAKHSDAFKIGTSEIPKTLMPYVSSHSSNTYVANMVYDTLLGSVAEPLDYNFPDGTSYVAPDDDNYFLFSDRLCKVEGAYPRKEGSDYGWIQFEPTAEQYETQLKRKGIQKGFDEVGDPIDETDEEFAIRAERAVPAHNWMEYRFEVRDGYTWNDGEPFTADDIVFTFQYALKNAGSLASVAYFLDSYYESYVDNGDLVLILATNKLSDIRTICSSILILPEHIWSEIRRPAQEKNLDPVGTGPYLAPSSDYIDDNSMTLIYRDDYNPAFAAEMFSGDPIKKITLLRLQNEDVTLNSLLMGDIDTSLDSLTAGKAYTVNGNDRYAGLNVSSYDSEFVATLALNVGKNGAFNPDKMKNSDMVRQAISLAIDQQGLIDSVLYGNGTTVGDGLVQSTLPHALKNADGSYADHVTDIERAKKLLDEAGYPADASGMRDLSFKILASTGSETLVNAIGKQLKEALGITIVFDLAKSDYSEVIKQSNGADFDMIINSVAFSTDKLLMFDARFGRYANGSARVWNVTGVNDETLSSLMWDMDTETDIYKQYEKARAVQARVAELYVEIPLYCSKNYCVYTDKNYTGWIQMKQGSVLNDYSMKYLKPAK